MVAAATFPAALALIVCATRGAASPGQDAPLPGPTCPQEMVLVDGRFCVDAFEAHLEEVDEDGDVVKAWPANKSPAGARVRAASERGVLPQAYITQSEASAACALAGKRLCTDDEWSSACRGGVTTKYPYGDRRRRGACNDQGVEPLAVLGAIPGSTSTWGFDKMNDPRLHLVPGGVAKTGRFDRCRSDVAVFDMVGNVHEWTASSTGTMRGGFYLDVTSLGEGCDYIAGGHDTNYRDYSTGFRCCADVSR